MKHSPRDGRRSPPTRESPARACRRLRGKRPVVSGSPPRSRPRPVRAERSSGAQPFLTAARQMPGCRWKIPRQTLPLMSFLLRASVVFSLLALTLTNAADRPRLAVLTDIGGDPDDQQSMIRLMVYANEFDLELLLASAS